MGILPAPHIRDMEKEIKLTSEALQALFEGKKLVFDRPDMRLTIYPDRYGVFMTHEKRHELESMIYGRAFEQAVQFLRNLDDEDKKEVLESELI